jgi:hypothetical protein
VHLHLIVLPAPGSNPPRTQQASTGHEQRGERNQGRDLLALHLDQYEPAVVPAADAAGVVHDQSLRLVETLAREWNAFRQATQLIEQIVGVDIMAPCTRHGLRHLRGVEVGEDLLNPSQLGDCVDTVCAQRLDQLIFIVLSSIPR